MFLKEGPAFTSYAISHTEPELSIKAGTTICSSHSRAVSVTPVYLGPSPELLHGYNLIDPECPIITCVPHSSKDIIGGVLEAILLRVEASASLGCIR